jgi:hypothetical protein
LYEGREAIKVVKCKVAGMPLQKKLSALSSKYPAGTRRLERPRKVCKIASKEICECFEETYGSRLRWIETNRFICTSFYDAIIKSSPQSLD